MNPLDLVKAGMLGSSISGAPHEPYKALAVVLDWKIDDLKSSRAAMLRRRGYTEGPAAYHSWRATSHRAA